MKGWNDARHAGRPRLALSSIGRVLRRRGEGPSRLFLSALPGWVLLGLALAMPAVARDLSFDHFIHTHIDARDGLPAQANAIMQTPDGYMWFGTPDGLYRYDGKSFERTPIARGSGLLSAAIIETIVTKRGEMWLSLGQNSGVAVLRNGAIHQTGMPQPPPQVTHLIEGTDGAIWAASSGREKRLYRYSGGRWAQMDVRLAMPSGAVADLEFDRHGTLWASLNEADGGKLAYLRAGSDRFETAGDRVGLGRLAIDGEGGLWLSDQFGTRKLREPSGRPPHQPIAYPPVPGILFPKIRFDRNGNIWGSSLSGGVFLIPDAENAAAVGTPPTTFDDNDRIGTVATIDVFPDREGNIWVSSSEALHRFHPANAVPVPGIASRPSAPQRLAAAKDGSVYLFSLGNLYRIRPNQPPGLHASGLGDNAVLCAARSGGVWLMQNERAILFGEGDRHTLPPLPPGQIPILCEEDGFGRLWALSRDQVSWYRDGRWHRGFPGLERIDLWDAATDASGALILGVRGNQLLRVDETGTTPLQTAWPGAISSMRSTRLGLLVSHTGGLWRAADKDGPAANLPVSSLAKRRDFDVDNNYLWSFGVNGLERIPLVDIARSWGKDELPRRALLFDWSEGLPVGKQEAGYRGRQMVAGSDGRLWLLTRAGPFVIDSRNIIRNTIPPRIVVSSLWADGHSHDPLAEDLRLPGGTRSVRIGYGALSYSVPDRVQFKYRLIGTGDEWTSAGNRHEVTFGNLGPGNYQFEVLGANEDGLWTDKPGVLRFTVAPTFLQSTGFKVAAALLLIGAAGIAYRWRTYILTTRVRNAMSERLAERDRIARELHDTLLQSVQGLILRFQLLVDRLPADHPSRQELHTTLDQADEVLAESRQRVLDLRAKQPRSDLKSVIAALAKRQLPASRFETEIRTSGTVVPVDTAVFNGLIDVANESLFNVLRHAQARKVRVDIRYTAAFLELEIADDGVGLDMDSVSTAITRGHLGLVGMKERVAIIGGKLKIDSAPGQGVVLTVRVPSSIAYGDKNKQTPRKRGGWSWFVRQARERAS